MRKRVKLSDALRQRGNIPVKALQPRKPTEPASKNGNGKLLFTVKRNSEQLEVADETWDVDRLGEFAKVEEEHVQQLGKQMAGCVWRLGKALKIAKEKVKAGEWKSSKAWCDFLKRYKVSVASDWRARTLFECCPDQKKAARMGITEAYRKFGLLAPPKKDEPEQPPVAPKAQKKEDDPPPPPKEDSTTLTMFLARVLQRLDIFFDEAAFVDQDKHESPDHVRDLIDQVAARLQKMKEMLPKQEVGQKQKKAKGNG
jgi:hypothetical protein